MADAIVGAHMTSRDHVVAGADENCLTGRMTSATMNNYNSDRGCVRVTSAGFEAGFTATDRRRRATKTHTTRRARRDD
jgi:hypothetical protein